MLLLLDCFVVLLQLLWLQNFASLVFCCLHCDFAAMAEMKGEDQKQKDEIGHLGDLFGAMEPKLELEDLGSGAPRILDCFSAEFYSSTLGKDAPIRDRFNSYMHGINDFQGGPLQFLHRGLPNNESKAAFAEWLIQEFPIHDNKEVWSEKDESLPRTPKTDFLIHVSQLGFDRNCSTKPPPFKKISMDLIGEYASSGFVTRGDALELDPTLHTIDGCPYFRSGYVKGMARSCTLLALLFGHYKGGIDLKTWPDHMTVIDITCRIEEVLLFLLALKKIVASHKMCF